MPTTREIQIYKFSELSPKARTKAIDKAREFMEIDSEALTEAFAEQLKEAGLPHKDIRWRLSSTQGDGVAFYGKVDIEEFLKKNNLEKKFGALKELLEEGHISAEIEKSRAYHMYDHSNTMVLYVNITRDVSKSEEEKAKELEEDIQEKIVQLSREFEKQGYAEIDFQTSDEAIAEHIEANDYEFSESGKQI